MERRQRSMAPAAGAVSLLTVLAVINAWGGSPARLPEVPGARVLVLAAPLPQPLTVFSDHCYFVVKDEGTQDWVRWEVWQSARNRGGDSWGHVQRGLYSPLQGVGGGEPWLLAEFRGEQASLFIDHLHEAAPAYEHRDLYLAYPGPNSNTFVDAMLRSGGLPVSLPPTAIGKDYRGLVGASWSSGGTGFQLESPLLGFKIGWREGVEVHAISLTGGFDFDPPALLGPLGDGRLGLPDQ